MKRFGIVSRGFVSSVVALVALASSSVALADEQPAASPADSSPPAVAVPAPSPYTTNVDRLPTEGPPKLDLVRINVGPKIGYVTDSGFDGYASNNVLPQFSIDATYPVLTRDKFVVGVGLGWDVGSRSDKARGFDSKLTMNRLYVPIEGRYHFKPWIYGFGKIAPGAAAMNASVTDGTTPSDLSATGWAFAADASIGGSMVLGRHKHFDRRALRFWITPEIGYSYTTTASLTANTGRDPSSFLGSDETTRLAGVALSGFFWRATISATF